MLSLYSNFYIYVYLYIIKSIRLCLYIVISNSFLWYHCNKNGTIMVLTTGSLIVAKRSDQYGTVLLLRYKITQGVIILIVVSNSIVTWRKIFAYTILLKYLEVSILHSGIMHSAPQLMQMFLSLINYAIIDTWRNLRYHSYFSIVIAFILALLFWPLHMWRYCLDYHF